MKFIKNLILIIYGFYIIYLPDFSVYMKILPKNSIILIIIALLNILVLNRRLLFVIKKLNLQYLFLIVFLALFQVFVLNLYNEFNLKNLWPLFQFMVQIINFVSLLIWFKKITSDQEKYYFFDFLFYIGLMQFVIILFMQFIPSFKEVAVTLYGGEEGVSTGLMYLLSYRIYGIASGYTFTLPLIQALLSILSLYLFFKNSKVKYLIYSLLLIYSSMLNSRTGLYLYIIIFAYFVFRNVSKKLNLKSLFYIITMVLGLVFVILIITLYPERFTWVSNGFSQIYYLVTRGEIKTDETLGVLFNQHIKFPKGSDFIWGIGSNIFNRINYNNHIIRSDIGYINDLFRGGITFVLVLYGSIFITLKRMIKNRELLYIIIFFILLANFKGEIMVGTSVIMLCLLIGFSLKYDSLSKP